MLMLYDFHTHTIHSDGILSPIELIRYACIQGYRAVAITDHAGVGSLERVLRETSADCALAMKHWDIIALPGIELTHLPPASIDAAARQAREQGARVVVVHGETVSEPVEKGTNLAAVNSRFVDILAHPGYITDEEAGIAARNGVYLELSGRRGHSTTNAHVAAVARRVSARMLVNSDAHADTDMLSEERVTSVLRAAGLPESERRLLEANCMALLEKLGHLPVKRG